jgi:hypothetical protein
MEKYLECIYPAEKIKLFGNAQNNNSPEDAMDLINKLPYKTYISPIETTRRIGKMK